MLKHIAYREGLHAAAGCLIFLALRKLWPDPWVTKAVIATLALLLVVSVREVWDLRVLKRAAVRVANHRALAGDHEYIGTIPGGSPGRTWAAGSPGCSWLSGSPSRSGGVVSELQIWHLAAVVVATIATIWTTWLRPTGEKIAALRMELSDMDKRVSSTAQTVAQHGERDDRIFVMLDTLNKNLTDYMRQTDERMARTETRLHMLQHEGGQGT